MIRVAKPTDPKKLAELKDKIHDKRYLEMAIARIANTLSKEIMDRKEE
ncbi:MAG: hypothetical protein JW852_04840 [Spirochaetales bacterium]|nr:hypothetical protein [Spirochaetales bacterium]